MNRRRNNRMRVAVLISATLHALVGVLFWSVASRAADLPELRVYAVDIVSPPPQELGEFDPLPGAEPAPVEEPAPEPPAPAPEPEEPAPPKKPEPKKEPPKEQPPKKETPKEAPKKEAPPKVAKETAREKPTPSKGANPSRTSPGGEDLDVKIEGARFVDPGYLANIQRQIHRYFRRPGASRTDVAEVQFYINRDGSVSEIEVIRHSGSFSFRVAAMEAVEQAGLSKSFGPLPKEYPADRLLVSFYFRPVR